MAASDTEMPIKARSSADKVTKKKKKTKPTSKLSKTTKEEDEPTHHSESPDTRPRKRKRDILPDGEIEIDINLPEPPSKKALRRAKKGKPMSVAPPGTTKTESAEEDDDDAPAKSGGNPNLERSKFGVWIGNLPWSATKETLRTFITERSTITDDQITRVNMPPPKKDTRPQQALKPQNKGFAYVDFSTSQSVDTAVALSETLMGGRRLLIKNANSFEGRPEKDAVEALLPKGGKPPNNRIFVGNLSFDVTKEDLSQHYAQCGEVADVHMATFEDSGKCKGFAWVTFEDLEAAKAAVIGWIYKSQDQGDDESDDSGDEDAKTIGETNGKKRKKKLRKMKWFVNQLHGRPVRVEFAEDKATRYKKRYGKESGDKTDNHVEGEDGGNRRYANGKQSGNKRSRFPNHEYQKVDARTIAPGAAHTNAQRGSVAIVESKGKKTTFD